MFGSQMHVRYPDGAIVHKNFSATRPSYILVRSGNQKAVPTPSFNFCHPFET
jgi:hypothetical protein